VRRDRRNDLVVLEHQDVDGGEIGGHVPIDGGAAQEVTLGPRQADSV
jgi:hypothetical protein